MNMLLVLLIAITCASAAYLEAKCLRDPCIPDNHVSLAGRRIKIVGYTILSLRFVLVLMEGIEVNWLGAFALLLIAFSDVIRCSNRLQLPRSVMGGAGQ